jgi:REP element-mobilizing transposase RayT
MPEQNSNKSVEKDWPHAPLHRLDTNGVFMITAATLYKEQFFRTPEKLTLLENTLLSLAKKYHWRLEAWAVFANHYHFVACGEEGALELDRIVKQLHDDTARELNRCDQTEGRAITRWSKWLISIAGVPPPGSSAQQRQQRSRQFTVSSRTS